jgi:hypothetical protein
LAVTKSCTAGTGPGEKAVEVCQVSIARFSQVTASPPCPAIMIALRALIARLTTRAFCSLRINSGKVGTRRSPALSSSPGLGPYDTGCTFGSSVQVLIRPLPRSNQAFWKMPWVLGKAPVATVACPAQVTVVR